MKTSGKLKIFKKYLMKSKNLRIVARLDIKNENVVKGIQLEDKELLVIKKNYQKDIIKRVLMKYFYNSVATLYGRNIY